MSHLGYQAEGTEPSQGCSPSCLCERYETRFWGSFQDCRTWVCTFECTSLRGSSESGLRVSLWPGRKVPVEGLFTPLDVTNGFWGLHWSKN